MHSKRILRTHLSNREVEHDLRRLISNLADSGKYINAAIRKSTRGIEGTVNAYGEEQAELDVLSDRLVSERLSLETSFAVCELASEEQGEIVTMDPHSGRYSVIMDPLDGSSLIDVNLAIGSIVGITEGQLLDGKTGRESLVAAMYIMYGPQTTLVYTAGDGVHEFVLDPVGNWVLEKENIQMQKQGNIYSPGGLRREWLPAHKHFIEQLEQEGYKLRYSGALVAEMNQLLIKGGGIFTYPALVGVPNSKLRLLMELQPMAMIMEQAGGRATNGIVDILNLKPETLDQRSPIYIGSKREVDLAREYLLE